MPYYVVRGNFTNNEDKITFNGEYVEVVDEDTKQKSQHISNGMIIFSQRFKEGTLNCEITPENIDPRTRFGFILDYKKVDKNESFYQCTLTNNTFGYSLDYWDGKKWDLKEVGGEENSLEKNRTYNLKIEKYGSEIKFYINDILLYTNTNITELSGAWGIYVYNAYKTDIKILDVIQDKPKVFAIMKFEKDFNELYKEVIIPQFEKYGYRVVRADECYNTTSIIQDITREIIEATIIIADITMDNANVFYEVGYAHALKKTTILLADANKREKLPFDLSGFRTIFYSNSIGGKREIENTLTKYIENINRES